MSQPTQSIRDLNLSAVVHSDLSPASTSGQNMAFSIGSVSNSLESPTRIEFEGAGNVAESICPLFLRANQIIQVGPAAETAPEFVSEFTFSSESMLEPMSPSVFGFMAEPTPEFVSEFVLAYDPQPSLIPPAIFGHLLPATPVLPVVVSVPLPLALPRAAQGQQCLSYSDFILRLGIEEKNILSLNEQEREVALFQFITAVELKREEVKELLQRLGWVTGYKRPVIQTRPLLSEALHCHRLLVLAYIIVVNRTIPTSSNITAILRALYGGDNARQHTRIGRRNQVSLYATSIYDWCILHLKRSPKFILRKMNAGIS